MTLLYIILGIIAWLGCGYFAAWLDFKFDIVDSEGVNDNLDKIILIGPFAGVVILFWGLLSPSCTKVGKTISTVLSRTTNKLKFKEKEEK